MEGKVLRVAVEGKVLSNTYHNDDGDDEIFILQQSIGTIDG